MSDTYQSAHALSPGQMDAAAGALRWAAFGGARRGLGVTYKQVSADRVQFETEYNGRKAWVDLNIPYTPVELIVAGALLLQQLNSFS